MLFSRLLCMWANFGMSALLHWLTGIAGNEASSRLRRLPLQSRFHWILGQGLTKNGKCGATFKPIKTMPRKLVAGSSRRRFSTVMQKRTPSMRIVISLRYQQDLSTEATAKLLGISIPAVKTRLLRARLAA